MIGKTALILALLTVVACTDEKNLGDRQEPSNSAVSGTAKGTIGGATFVPTSALAHAHLGYVHGQEDVPAIDLIFTSDADACGTAKNDEFVPGATYVALHDVRAEVGTDTVSDAEVFVVDASCPTGTRLDRGKGLASSGQVTEASVTFTRIDAERVEGSVSAKFDDLSAFEGTFSLVPCTGSGSSGFGNSPVCQ